MEIIRFLVFRETRVIETRETHCMKSIIFAMLVLSRVSVFAYQMVDVTPETQVVNSCAKPFGYGHATNPEIILGDPIDPATGAYSVNESWIHIYGSDPLDLRFFYNSQRLIRAEQGFGISFEAYLEETHNRGLGYR
jgi:hypothetical protein